MNTRKAFTLAVSSLGLALIAQTSFAAGNHLVTHSQLDQIQKGDSIAQVTRTLGAPADVTSWAAGKHSMDYEISSPSDMQRIVYVNLNRDNKVTGIQILSRD